MALEPPAQGTQMLLLPLGMTLEIYKSLWKLLKLCPAIIFTIFQDKYIQESSAKTEQKAVKLKPFTGTPKVQWLKSFTGATKVHELIGNFYDPSLGFKLSCCINDETCKLFLY